MRSALLAIICFLALTINGNAQVAFADPATTQLDVTTLGNVALNANELPINQPILVKVPLFNFSQGTAVPSGSIIVKIGLGSKVIVDPGFLLATAPLSAYFAWTSAVNGDQVEIQGNLIAPLPPDFEGTAIFRVKPVILGTSTMQTNVLITNHNTTTILSDLDGNNNTANLQYTVVDAAGPVPVTFTKLNLLKKGCNINVNFFTENEINVGHYEIEASKDGINFVRVATIAADHRSSYIKDFSLTQDIKAPSIFVRVKSVDLDGNFKYSETKSIGGQCAAELQYNVYPNPVTGKNLALLATSGLFNGKYKLTIMDMSGRLIQMKEVEMTNASQYNLELSAIASGKYILRVANLDGSDTRALAFEKL